MADRSLIKQDSLEEALAIVDVGYGSVKLDPPEVKDWSSFGQLIPMSERERGQLHSLREILRRFIARSSHRRPLCLAVFGPPGSGKTFAVRQLAEKSLAQSAPKLVMTTINLTQLSSTAELAGAIATALQETPDDIPLLFFDEFDTSRDGATFGWLSWFLAPMHEGEFIHNGKIQQVKRAVLVFAGGTAATMSAFNASGGDPTFRNAKGPDFVSRLRGFLDVAGPNAEPRMLRRAIIMRSELERRLQGLGGEVHVEKNLLEALLKVGRYRHGARSIAALIELSQPSDRTIDWSSLPHENLIDMQVDRGPLDSKILGGAIALSGFRPADHGVTKADDPTTIEAGWAAVIHGLLDQGATLAFAGGWHGQSLALTRLVKQELAKRPPELSARQETRDMPRPRFISFLRAFDYIEMERQVDAVVSRVERRRLGIVIAPPVPLTDAEQSRGDEWSRRVVERFRRRLAVTEQSVARFIIGGEPNKEQDRPSGVVEETILSLACRHPIYVAGGFGGAAADIGTMLGLSELRTGVTPNSMLDRLDDHQRTQLREIADDLRPPPYMTLPVLPGEQVEFLREHAVLGPRWPDNGLTGTENRELFASRDPETVTRLVIIGLLRRFALLPTEVGA